jgi:uncharacterized membrane protein YccC
MAEKRHRIMPNLNLRIGLHGARRNDRDRKQLGYDSDLRELSNGIASQPDNDYKKADEGKICITLGQGLIADLHDADHRRQRSQEPQPADEAIRPVRQEMPADGGYDEKRKER